MKYCPKCKKVYMDDVQCCTECKNRQTVLIEDKHTPLVLCNCNASQREMLIATLKDNGVVSSYENQAENSGMAMEGFNVLVPAGMYKKACEIAVQMGMLSIDDDFCDAVEKMAFEADENDYQDMSAAKRTTIKVLSAIGLIILFSLAIFGVDYVMALIKNLFM